jgi:hypothetical protein
LVDAFALALCARVNRLSLYRMKAAKFGRVVRWEHARSVVTSSWRRASRARGALGAWSVALGAAIDPTPGLRVDQRPYVDELPRPKRISKVMPFRGVKKHSSYKIQITKGPRGIFCVCRLMTSKLTLRFVAVDQTSPLDLSLLISGIAEAPASARSGLDFAAKTV